jgi:hypothetical protein
MELAGQPIYLSDMADACLLGRLNMFLIGDTGSGKTQLMRDMMGKFGDKAVYILGRNDMDTRELFQQINLEKLKNAKNSSEVKELTDKVGYHLIAVDELPNCVPAVRGQLFNLFDGFVEINGHAYPIGDGYSVGIAAGNLGQKFTESSNDLGRALKDRMHVIVDTDYFTPKPSDTFEILSGNTNPRVSFEADGQDGSADVIARHKTLVNRPVPFEKLLLAGYLIDGLDYATIGDPANPIIGSKRKMKDRWPNDIANNQQGSDEALVLPLSTRAAKSTIRLSQSLDSIVQGKAGKEVSVDALESMMQAYKFVSAYSGVLNDAMVDANYGGNKYAALDAVIQSTQAQYLNQENNIRAGLEMVRSGKIREDVLNLFGGRWVFMRDLLTHLTQEGAKNGN